MSEFDVETEDVSAAAKAFAVGQSDLYDVWTSLNTGLAGHTGMAGNQHSGQAFAAKYDPALAVAWQAMSKACGTLGRMSTALAVALNNYLRADYASIISDKVYGGQVAAQAYQLTDIPSVITDTSVAVAPPLAASPTYLMPNMPGWLAEYWPDADVEGLHDAARLLRTAASSVEHIAERLALSVKSITPKPTRDARAITRYWTRVYVPCAPGTLLGGLPELLRNLATACDIYAEAVKSTVDKMETAFVVGGYTIVITAVGVTIEAIAGAAGLSAAGDAGFASLSHALQSSLIALAGALLVTSQDPGIRDGLVAALTTAISNIPSIQIIHAEPADPADFDKVLRDWQAPSSGEPDAEDLEKNVRKIAKELGYTQEEINQAIHGVKGQSDWRGISGSNNPDILVDIGSGEVYVQTADGAGESSIGNVFDYLHQLPD